MDVNRMYSSFGISTHFTKEQKGSVSRVQIVFTRGKYSALQEHTPIDFNPIHPIGNGLKISRNHVPKYSA